jgi:hypothetical protein
MYDVTVAAASAARTATGTSAVLASDVADELGVVLSVTAVSGTAPTLVLSVEWSMDGVLFAAADPVDAFTSVNAQVAVTKLFKAKAPYYRLRWTIAGTTPSFTFSVNTFTN